MATAGNIGAVLTPILETDDITIDRSESTLSAPSALVPLDGVARPSGVEGTALQASNARPVTSAVRRSVIATTVDATRRAIEHHANHRVSWSATRDRLSSLGSKHAKTPPDVIRAMTPRVRIGFYLTQPEESQLGWLLHHLMLVILIVNTAVMAAETLDGPRFGSTQPGYSYLPGDSFFLAVENGFTVIYILDFVLRAATALSQRVFWKCKYTWINFVAWLPALLYQGVYTMNHSDPSFNSIQVRGSINYLRLARLLRIIAMTRVYVGSKVMFKATKESIAPLKITLFFLITVVMVFATAIFYAEPCYDLKTCTFTDIFNAGYFVMVTVATVGYGSQVPSLQNGASVFLTVLIMIFGSLYLAMPLAIVGIRYDSAWREYEHTKREASKVSQQFATTVLAQATAVNEGQRDQREVRKLQHKLLAKQEPVDDTLEPLETGKVYTTSYQICGRFYAISQKVGEVTDLVRSMFDELPRKSSFTTPSPSQSPRPSVAALGGGGGETLISEEKANSAQIQRVKARNETIVKVVDIIAEVLKLHKKIGVEIRGLLPVMDHLAKTTVNARSASGTRSMTRRDASFSKTATGVFSRARSMLSSVRNSHRGRFLHVGSPTWRSRTWDLLEHNDFSRTAKIINRIRLYLVVLSIVLFYAQTTPELQATGVKTLLCRRTLWDFCHSKSPGFGDQPGCFVMDSAGHPTTTAINFACSNDASDVVCYGNGYNFGSTLFAGTCEQVFGRKGIQRICNNRLCKPPLTLWVDMEEKWIGIEFFFGILFTVEMLLRLTVHPDPKKAYRDVVFLIDLVALFPFFVEIGEIVSGTMPVYSVVPTAPSFFAVIRVFKTFRVLKLGPHISGSEVLARTAFLVKKRLMIPVFFLFIGSVMSGAIFYELERGTECFVGNECLWWGKELLTPEIDANLPEGKRILVQDNRPTLIKDMLRSTWFAIVTMTTVGYGDMRPRTALGRFFDILLTVVSACYTAMPLTLVGGQFYVCYEVYLRDKRRAQNALVEPKPFTASSEHMAANGTIGTIANDQSKDAEVREPVLMSLAGLADDPVIPGLNARMVPSSSTSPPRSPVAPALGTRRSMLPSGSTSPKEPTRPAISSVELQLLNHFILMNKVLDEVVEDLSQFNKLGSQRVATKKDKPDENATLLAAEAQIKTKIDNNLTFCATVLLNFAPVIEKVLGLQDARVNHTALTIPSILDGAPALNELGTALALNPSATVDAAVSD